MNTTADIRTRAAQIAEQAKNMTITNTETINAADINPGDVITKLGKQEFPFPFTIASVRPAGRNAVILTATHGWFTMRPVAKNDTAVRVS